MPILAVKNLFCERDDRVLFENLNFSLASGEIIQIEGQNGSGKTTLLRILCGLNGNYEGDILWQNQAIDAVRDQFLSALLYLGHHPGIKTVLTAEENLRWYEALHPMTADINMETALEQVGLRGFEDVPCHNLSAGQHRRVALARLRMSNAPLWILDEPFTAIDKRGVVEQEALIAAHARAGGSIVLTTHHELAIHAVVKKINLDKLP